MKYPIKGSCLCGRVTYTLREPPITIAACHCKQCQKLSTSAFSISAMVNASAVEVVGEMKEWRRTGASGQESVARFCPCCGTHIYHSNPARPDTLMLKLSSLEDTSIIDPTVHVWVQEKQDWYQIPEGVTSFATQP